MRVVRSQVFYGILCENSRILITQTAFARWSWFGIT